MSVMMLDLYQRKTQLAGNCRSIVFRVLVACGDLWLGLKQIAHPSDGLLQSSDRPDIFCIPDIRRRIEKVVSRHAEGVFEFSADSQNTALTRHIQHEWQRSITS